MSSGKESDSNGARKLVTVRDVLWYIPNQIGYIRVVTAIVSFLSMRSHPSLTGWFYGISCMLDALDGTMARKYDQCSRVGAVLDMVADRSTTAGLLCSLCIFYPQYSPIFQTLLGLDISSHYMHMYATLVSGGSSHKQVKKENSRLLHLYYTNRVVLFMICAFNEIFYAGLYLMHFDNCVTAGKILVFISLPGYIFKQTTNIIQLNRATLILAGLDAKDANEKRQK